MGHNDHIDFELYDHLIATIEGGFLDEFEHKDAIGVARQVIHLGHHSLSPKQRVLYEKIIVPALESAAEKFRVEEIVNRAPE